MKHLHLLAIAGLLLPATLAGAQKPAPKPHPVKATFYLTGVNSAAAVKAVTASVLKAPSVTGVTRLTPTSGFAIIAFNTHRTSYHQIAQAIAAASPDGGPRFAATVRIQIPQYAEGENAGKIDAIFLRRARFVRVETLDKAKGLFAIHFLPLREKPGVTRPQGFNLGQFGHPVRDMPPKGLGLKFRVIRERTPKPGK